MTRKFISGYLRSKHDPQVIRLSEKVKDYDTSLKSLGIKDHQVKNVSIHWLWALLLLVYRGLFLLFISLLLFPGLILNSPILIITSYVSREKAREALKNSNVKLKGNDVIATWKVFKIRHFILYILLFIVTDCVHIYTDHLYH